jgi:hypothetical protein
LLHTHCAGEGSPTVVLDHLGDGTSAPWGWVQPEVAEVSGRGIDNLRLVFSPIGATIVMVFRGRIQ